MYKKISVFVPTRHHASVKDMTKFSYGIFGGGGVGFATSNYIKITLEENSSDLVKGPNSMVVIEFLRRFRTKYNVNQQFKINISTNVKPHVGYGSTGSIVIGVLVALIKLYNLPVTDKELVSFYMMNACEEHDRSLVPCFETGVGPWAVLKGGIVVVGTNGSLICHREVEDYYTILTVFPNTVSSVDISNECNTINILGKKFDKLEHDQKKLIFESFKKMSKDDKATTLDYLQGIKKLQKLGSKKAEKIAINNNYSSFVKECERVGEENGICSYGLSSLGPAFYYIDESLVIENLQEEISKDLKDVKTNISHISPGIIIEME